MRSFILYFFILASSAWAGHFPQPVSTPYICDFLGTLSINGLPAKIGDEVAFVDSDGVYCGVYSIKKAGIYGFVHVYGDDPTTQIDEGARSGEEIKIIIWDSQLKKEYHSDTVIFSPGQLVGNAVPSYIPPKWITEKVFSLNIEKPLKGDMNKNGKIELLDIILLLQIISK